MGLAIALLGLVGGVRADGPTFQVDTKTSRVYARVDAGSRLGHPHGVEGTLAAGRLQLDGAGELVIDLTSFQVDTDAARGYVGLTGSVSAGDRSKTTANMQSADVLNVAVYPRATYAIAAVKPLDGQAPGQPGRYQLVGKFTLHGATQVIGLMARAEPVPNQPGQLRLRGQFAVNQTDFGITPYSALGGIVKVADTVTIWGDLILTPAK
jgi:polyisoprenoid-binding protein YceI